jgi:hypothetical protein
MMPEHGQRQKPKSALVQQPCHPQNEKGAAHAERPLSLPASVEVSSTVKRTSFCGPGLSAAGAFRVTDFVGREP